MSAPEIAYVIHLETETVRLPLLQTLQETLPFPLNIFHASNGALTMANPRIPKAHPHNGTPIQKGNIGCTESHLSILSKMTDKPYGIFEDDCEIHVSKSFVQDYLSSVEQAYPTWDLLLLGASEYVDSKPGATPLFVEVKRFWGTHALIVSPRAAAAIQASFQAGLARGVFYPADWLYSAAIQEHGLKAIGPVNPHLLCKQKSGLISAITGMPR
jgi:GR25 family glycosyltransferase involved in LPS biosynthesis